MKATNIPAYPSLDKFVFAVLNYMEIHKFTKVPDYQEIELQADRAYDAWSEAIRSGHTITQAAEISNQVLFENIGESEYEVVESILKSNFKDTVDLSEDDAVTFWVNRVLSDVPDLFENCEYLTYGISAADIDINRDVIIGRITEYFESYGLQ